LRLDKLLSNRGYGSRKEVKEIIKKGHVLVNEERIKDGKTQIDPIQQIVTVFGEKVEYKEFIYLMMNKPPGVVSATEDTGDKTVIDLLGKDDQLYNPFPVGRLDKDTVGLLLLTNNGKLSHQLLSPNKHVTKTYFAKIKGVVTNSDVEAFQTGVTLDDGYVTMPATLRILSSGEQSEIELDITEGKFHQVKRMFEAVDKKVVYLKRIKMASLQLDPTLSEGEYRELTKEELQLLE